MKHPLTYILALVAMFAFFSAGTAVAEFEGRQKCSSCHKSQAKSWRDTAHAKAMVSLRPGERAEAKEKAGLRLTRLLRLCREFDYYPCTTGAQCRMRSV